MDGSKSIPLLKGAREKVGKFFIKLLNNENIKGFFSQKEDYQKSAPCEILQYLTVKCKKNHTHKVKQFMSDCETFFFLKKDLFSNFPIFFIAKYFFLIMSEDTFLMNQVEYI